MIRIVLALLLAGAAGCAMFDEYDYDGYEYVYDAGPTHAPAHGMGAAAAYGRTGQSPCGCSTGSRAMAAPPPPPSIAYQPTGPVIPASASQSPEPDLLNR